MWQAFVIGSLALIAGLVLLGPKQLIVVWADTDFRVELRILRIKFPLWKGDLRARAKAAEHPGSRGTRNLDMMIRRFAQRERSLADDKDDVSQAIRSALRLARRFRHWLSLESGRIELVIGLPNPAQTGMVHGALSALSGMLMAKWPRLVMQSVPNFDGSSLGSHGELIFRVYVWRVLWHSISFLATTPWPKLWKLKRSLAYR